MPSSDSLTTSPSALLLHLQRLLTSPTGLEASLCTLFYTLRLLHTYLHQRLTSTYDALALDLTALTTPSATTLDPDAQISTLLNASPPPLALRSACILASTLSRRVQLLRRVLRLPTGLLTIYNSAQTLYTRSPRDAPIKLLLWAQIGARSVWQGTEHGALIAEWTGRKGAEEKCWRWANRAWLGWVGLEMVRLARVRQLRYREEWGAEEKRNEVVRVKSEELRRRWWRNVAASVGWLGYCLDWRVEDELVKEDSREPSWLGVAGIVPGVIALQDAWRASA